MRPLSSLTWTDADTPAPTLLASVKLNSEQDVVLARQRGRQIAQLLGYDQQNQVRIATAVSEIAREGLQHGGISSLDFGLRASPGLLLIRLTCPASQDAAGVAQASLGLTDGLVMARRMLTHFQADVDDKLCVYLFGRALPPAASAHRNEHFQEVAAAVEKSQARSLYQEYQAHNQELLEALGEARRQRLELAKVNRELEETNRGVVALYSELEEKADSLRKVNEQRSRFYSSISHEFRTPVTSILSLSQILLNRLDGELTSEQERQVSLIRQCGMNLLDWVNDLLDLARADAGRLHLRLGSFKLNDLLSGLRGIMRPLADNRSVSLIIECPPALEDIELTTDEVKLSQILRNFVSNALKFTEQGEVRVYPQADAERPDMLTLVVKDTGIGIAQVDQQRVFDEFVQIDSPLQRKSKGTGLGLPLSRRLAELLGGSIDLESVPGQGTTFRLTIPRERTPLELEAHESPAPESPNSNSEASQSVRILLIDDDMASRYLLGQVLEQMGAEVLEAGSGAEGLDRAITLRPHAIFLDLLMPDLHGSEVLELLKQSAVTCDIPVVIYSSQPDDITDHPEWQSLVTAVVEKPKGSDGPPRVEIERALREAGITTALGAKESRS